MGADSNMREITPQLNACFAALSDPTRRAVIEHLVRSPATVSALAAPHDMALPTFMRHLSVLESCGLVRSEKTGRVRTCHIEASPLLEVQGWLEWQRMLWEQQLDQIDQLALSLDTEPKK
jgi:DNA-binding transcriptional ArsR family regulator